MKVSEVINRIERIQVVVDVFEIEDMKRIDPNIIEDVVDLLTEYKDELLNKVVK